MPVLISDLWTPAIWIQGATEKQATLPSLLNSGVVTRTPELDAIASGAGTSVNIPFFKDITDQTDEIQVENTGPTTDNGQPSGLMVGTVLNRVTKNSAGALAAQVSGSDPVGSIVYQIAERRLKQRQLTLIATLRGLFNATAVANAAAPLSAVRYGGTTAEPFIETGNTAVAANKISIDMFVDTCALMGELSDDLKNGVFLCHPVVKAALLKLDGASFKNGVQSGLPYTISTYREVPIFTSASLVRAGTTNGFVYDSYLMARGSVGMGEKAQQGDTVDVASLQYWRDPDKNNEFVYDRTRFLMQVLGTKWVGTPAGQSATNAELQTAANWNLVFQTANRCGAACLRTNG